MKRSDFLRNTALVGAAALMPFPTFSSIAKRSNFTEIRRGVGMYRERGGTIGWLMNDNALVAVDSQYPETAANFIAGVKDMTSRKMDYLINSHHHGDHTAGNSAFKGFTSHIVAHENVPGYQKTAAESRDQETVDAQVYADMTFADKWSQDLGDETVHLTHYGPAHTGGDSVIYFENANVAHMGDLVFNRAYPYIDPGAGANITNWVQVLRSTADDLPNDAIYIFGHGNPKYGVTGSKGDVIVMSDFLEELLSFVQKGIDAGKSKEEIARTEVLPGFEEFAFEGWFLGLDFELNTAYDELTNK
ncbi:MAG: MBL fold metallo-hydrolase [Balneolaceae bacterium]|nr:MBL fold metallo-hydrolase [Balneolaceae bacterium]